MEPGTMKELIRYIATQLVDQPDAARGAGMPEGQVFWTVERGAAAQWLRERVEPGDAVLVKGSRGVRLEEVAEALDTWVATRAAEPAIAT